MEIEIVIDNKDLVERYARSLIKFSKSKLTSDIHKIYNIKDPNVPGIMWIISLEKKGDE